MLREEDLLKIICAGRSEFFVLFLKYLRKMLFTSDQFYYLTFRYYSLELRIDKQNYYKLISLVNKETQRNQKNREIFENLKDEIEFGLKNINSSKKD